jgi:hypothetical protein
MLNEECPLTFCEEPGVVYTVVISREINLPLKAWMSVCVYSVFVLYCVCRLRPCDGLSTRPRSPTDCVKKITKLKRPGPNKWL